MRDYVKRRHKQDWDAVQQRMDELLRRASNFIEPLTRLPLVATLLAELLPTMDLKEVPKSRWELFNTLLLRGLLRRDLPGSEAEVVTNDFHQLPPERQEALLLLCDLALDGLLARVPKLVFKYADIVAKCQGKLRMIKDEVLEVARSVMASFCETDETQEEVTYYHFLHLSFQEFLAALAVKYSVRNRAKGTGALKLASCVATLQFGVEFNNFWRFTAGFFKSDAEMFFRTLLSSINIDTKNLTRKQMAMQNMLINMLQEIVPEINDSAVEKNSSALELLAVTWNRKFSNIELGPDECYSICDHDVDLDALSHALRLMPDLLTVQLGNLRAGYLCAALRSQHKLQTLHIVQSQCYKILDDEVDALTALLHTTQIIDLQLVQLPLSADQLQTLAGGLSSMSHSLKRLHVCGPYEQEHEKSLIAMEALFLAITKHHTNLLILELDRFQLDREDAMHSLNASLMVHSRNVQRLALTGCSMSRGTFEPFCSAVQANRSLTALRVDMGVGSPDSACSPPWSSQNNVERCAAIQQLSHAAIHSASITRLEMHDWGLQDNDVMSIVREVVKTKDQPHQLTQLSLQYNNDLTVEIIEQFQDLIQKEGLILTIASERLALCSYCNDEPIVERLPLCNPHEWWEKVPQCYKTCTFFKFIKVAESLMA